MKKLLVVVLVLFACSGVVSAAQVISGQSITLLSVAETSSGTYVGGTADLFLELRPGDGSVFIDSYPLTKIDTQVATRIANEIACEFSAVDCTQFDFFYTIRANSPIIGGPSAGGATALLTLATLEGHRLPANLAMTGGVASGGVITAVSGIIEKVYAAEEEGRDIVLIPEFAIVSEKSEVNNSLNLSDELDAQDIAELESLSIELFSVRDVREALALVTSYKKPTVGELNVPDYYQTEMQRTAGLLCERTESLLAQVEPDENNSIYNISVERYGYGQENFVLEQYYAAASFCYTANLRAQQLIVTELSQEERKVLYDDLVLDLIASRKEIDSQELRTFGDLETYGIVKERLLESQRYLDEVNVSNISTTPLAFAIERYFSAQAWSGFFGVEQNIKLQLDQKTLRNACMQELQLVDGRLNYLRTFVPELFLDDITQDQRDAYVYLNDKSYPLCLFKATQAKAQADVFVSSTTLYNDSTDGLIDAKQERTKEVIVAQGEVFPILGYSYYEYAQSLQATDSDASLLFSEYALAFSDLSAYFPVEKKQLDLSQTSSVTTFGLVLVFFAGIVVGAIITVLIGRGGKSSRSSRSSSRKKP